MTRQSFPISDVCQVSRHSANNNSYEEIRVLKQLSLKLAATHYKLRPRALCESETFYRINIDRDGERVAGPGTDGGGR